MAKVLRMGDNIALYCESTMGYVFSCNSTSVVNGLTVFHKQEKSYPSKIIDQQTIKFQVCIQNRFKMTKKYRKLYSNVDLENVDMEIRIHESQAKAAADAENKDNDSEQTRNNGKEVRYGDVLQLKHIFTDKYIHVNHAETSTRDKNNMLISLERYNDKSALFRIIPRFKVKSEGEVVQYGDQITFESVKSPGRFFHSCPTLSQFQDNVVAEVNLGVDQTAYTLVYMNSFIESGEEFARGGQFVQLFHKELEAFVVAEGSQLDGVTENVHLRIREVDNLNPRSLRAPTSAITYWQIEDESSNMSGDPLMWEIQVRFRHATTRKYLCIDENGDVGLSDLQQDPQSVFKIHPINMEGDNLQLDSYVRIEHVMTGCWLHALKDQSYERTQLSDSEDESSMKALKWDGADLRKIAASVDQEYDDAFSIQVVLPVHVKNFNYVAGLLPYFYNLIDEAEKGKYLGSKKTYRACKTMNELCAFLTLDGKPCKARQKLLRNLRLLDLVVRYIQTMINRGNTRRTSSHAVTILKECYNIIYAYMMGNSRKNALYFAKYIDIFLPYMLDQNELGFKAVQIIVELIRDNRKIVDRINQRQINRFLQLVRQNQNHNYLELLHVLCVCNNVAITENQNYITDKWLIEDQEGIYLTEVGEHINRESGVIYVSPDRNRTWIPMQEFLNSNNENYSEDMALFLLKQLKLFNSLCYGRNEYVVDVITRRAQFISWGEAFLGLTTESIQANLRVKYCQLIMGLFFDSGTNYSVIENPRLSFLYEKLTGPPEDIKLVEAETAKELQDEFQAIKEWIGNFLEENQVLVASQVAHNALVRQVLLLLGQLVRFGYYTEIHQLQSLFLPLQNLLDGNSDIPFPPDKGESFTREKKKLVHKFKQTDRYKQTPENQSVVEAKYAAIDVLKVFLAFEGKVRLESFIRKFKECETKEPLFLRPKKKYKGTTLTKALDEKFDPHSNGKLVKMQQKKMLRELRKMEKEIAFIRRDKLTPILVDLAAYEFDKMNQKALSAINILFTDKEDMFQNSLDSLIIITDLSTIVHSQASSLIPRILLILRSKWTDEQVEVLISLLNTLIEFCHQPNDPNTPHPVNQKILVSLNVLNMIFRILAVETDAQLQSKDSGTKMVLQKAIHLLQALTRNYQDMQCKVFDRLDEILRVEMVDSDLALAMIEIFNNNMNLCLKIQPRQVQKIISHLSDSQVNAPELLQLLGSIVKIKGSNLPLKRNQTLVMKYLMQNFARVAYVFEEPMATRIEILKGNMGKDHQIYFLGLMDLLAMCNEGENRFIESLSQNILSEEDIIRVIVEPDLPFYVISPFLNFLSKVYISRDVFKAGENEHIPEDNFWNFLTRVSEELEMLTTVCRDSGGGRMITDLIRTPMDRIAQYNHSDTGQRIHSFVTFLFEGFCNFIQLFYTQNFVETISCDTESELQIMQTLTNNFANVMSAIVSGLTKSEHLKMVIETMNILQERCDMPMSIVDSVTKEISVTPRYQGDLALSEGHGDYHQQEIELNIRLKTFTVICSLLYGGHNTVQAQLKQNSKRQYTSIGGMDALPLGEEFQNHINCFIRNGQRNIEAKLKTCALLVKQLHTSALMNYSSGGMFGVGSIRGDQERLDIRCLQILRAIIHNEERKLPEDWQFRTAESGVKSGLKTIEKIQSTFSSYEISLKILPHLANPKDEVCKEVLALQSMLLFNANRVVQLEMINYFYSTREEVFFFAVRNRLQMSAEAIKELRILKEQRQMQKKTAIKPQTSVAQDMTVGAQALRQIEYMEMLDKMDSSAAVTLTRSVNLAKIQSRSIQRAQMSNGFSRLANGSKADLNESDIKIEMGSQNRAYSVDFSDNLELRTMKTISDDHQTGIAHTIGLTEDVEEEEPMASDDYTELVLRVLASICDGQNQLLQDYLRSQPDNVKSFNLVAEVTLFIGVLYSNIDQSNIDLAIEVFSTINECVVGNKENRITVYDSKIMDYINFIIRVGRYPSIPIDKMIELWSAIAGLLLSLIEENDADSLVMISEIKETLDKEAIYRIMYEAYRIHAKDEGDADSKESAEDLGFALYRVMARLYDVDPNMGGRQIVITPEQMRAFKFYKKNCMSVELIKDNYIQKVNFRVRNKQVIREEVKENVKWNVDRTSPSNKLRDFKEWSTVILEDALYQRKVLKNPILRILTGGWMTWNKIVFLLSLIICILMLIGKTVPPYKSISEKHPINNSAPVQVYLDPNSIWDPHFPHFNLVVYVLGIMHNIFCCLVILTYFISNHPSLPPVKSWIRSLCSKKDEDNIDSNDTPSPNKVVSASLFSMLTLYYLLSVGCSFIGTFFSQYFFAFHLLNIVNDNPTLQGVIKAITQNGISLLWVGVLSIIMILYFTIFGFTFYQSGIDHDNLMFCDNMAQCLFTHLRFGIVADFLENVLPNSNELNFTRFTAFVILHLVMYIFITIIMLNLIFGIIVDTFSELRDLKWQAEADMRNVCFICSRPNFEFEHAGKGFTHHVREEHNMWAYIFFFIHLQDTKTNDYTSIELHIHRQLEADSTDFFPFNRSLCLSHSLDQYEESKLDKLVMDIKELNERHNKEIQEKKRYEEIERQRKWRGKFGTSRGGRRMGGSVTTQSSVDTLDGRYGALPRYRSDIMESRWTPPLPPSLPEGQRSQYRRDSALDCTDDYIMPPPPPPVAPRAESGEDTDDDEHPVRIQDISYPSDDPMRFLDDYDTTASPVDTVDGDSLGSTHM